MVRWVAREAASINKSLSAIGDVVAALTTGQGHVPYRSHALTTLMSDSIGGTAKTVWGLGLLARAHTLFFVVQYAPLSVCSTFPKEGLPFGGAAFSPYFLCFARS